jgi:hypothetical protein
VPYDQTPISRAEIDALANRIREFNFSLMLVPHTVAGIKPDDDGKNSVE